VATERHDLGAVIEEHLDLAGYRRPLTFPYPYSPEPDAPRDADGRIVRLPLTLPEMAPMFRRPFDWQRDLDPRRDF